MTRELFLDLTRHHWRREQGDITVFGTWVGPDREPCLVLAPTAALSAARSPGGRRFTPFVVRLREAFELDRDDPHFREHIVLLAHMAGEALGLGYSRALCHRIATILHDGLADLMRIPPAPVEAGAPVADGVATVDGRTTEFTILEG